MKQITQSLADLPYTMVNFGVDTLILNVRYADDQGAPLHSELTEDQIDQLNKWQAIYFSVSIARKCCTAIVRQRPLLSLTLFNRGEDE